MAKKAKSFRYINAPFGLNVNLHATMLSTRLTFLLLALSLVFSPLPSKAESNEDAEVAKWRKEWKAWKEGGERATRNLKPNQVAIWYAEPLPPKSIRAQWEREKEAEKKKAEAEQRRQQEEQRKQEELAERERLRAEQQQQIYLQQKQAETDRFAQKLEEARKAREAERKAPRNQRRIATTGTQGSEQEAVGGRNTASQTPEERTGARSEPVKPAAGSEMRSFDANATGRTREEALAKLHQWHNHLREQDSTMTELTNIQVKSSVMKGPTTVSLQGGKLKKVKDSTWERVDWYASGEYRRAVSKPQSVSRQ